MRGEKRRGEEIIFMVWLTKEGEGEVGEGNEAGKVRSPKTYTASPIWMMWSSCSTLGRNKIPICTHDYREDQKDAHHHDDSHISLW